MKTSSQIIGKMAEDAVIKVMQEHGFILLERNFTVHNLGEIDSIFMKGNDIYMVEVKSRLSNPYFPVNASITPEKRKRLIKTAEVFIKQKEYYGAYVRFLAGLVTHNRYGIIQNVEIIPFC